MEVRVGIKDRKKHNQFKLAFFGKVTFSQEIQL